MFSNPIVSKSNHTVAMILDSVAVVMLAQCVLASAAGAQNIVVIDDLVVPVGYPQDNTLPRLAGLQVSDSFRYRTATPNLLASDYTITATIRSSDGNSASRNWVGSFSLTSAAPPLPTAALYDGSGIYSVSFAGNIRNYFTNGNPLIVNVGVNTQESFVLTSDGTVTLYDQAGCSPVLIDTLGDGLHLTDAASGVNFDFIGSGTPVSTAWTMPDSDDAFLALDRNNNGRIDTATELFGNFTAQPLSRRSNGFAALAEFDKSESGGNADGNIDSEDAVFSSLLLWRDANHNGFSESDELVPIAAFGIRGIGLKYIGSKLVDEHGNKFRYKSRVLSDNQQVGKWAWDVFFVTNGLSSNSTNSNLSATGAKTVNPGIDICPADS
ncbi:MAG: hypothetical protein H7Y22_06760 [Gemmatimonadaceae bacterium]|nr:hypothetical protein [Gloeobacterales cyanobacterium ES-bin-141]